MNLTILYSCIRALKAQIKLYILAFILEVYCFIIIGQQFLRIPFTCIFNKAFTSVVLSWCRVSESMKSHQICDVKVFFLPWGSHVMFLTFFIATPHDFSDLLPLEVTVAKLAVVVMNCGK